MSYNQRRERTIEDLGTEEDLRTLNDGYTENRKDMYNAMLNLILKHKVELQKIPATSAVESAKEWARKRGLRAGTKDLDGDGRPETIVYNKAGKPWIINGYRLKASDYPIRNAFYTRFPTAEDRAGENMKKWIQEEAYDVRVDPQNPWRKHVRNTQFGDNLREWGYRMPTKPKRKQSVFNIFCKLIAPYLKDYYESEELYYKTFLQAGSGTNSVKLFKKIVSPISIYRILYMKAVERPYFFHTIQKEEYSNMSYKQFKKYMKNFENRYYSWFKKNYLADNQTEFREGRITPLVIQGLFIKDNADLDGSDPDDAIIFMLGVENIRGDCGGTLSNDEASENFLEALSDKKHSRYKEARKSLAKWKKIASASQKDFFKNQIQFLFENGDAKARFDEAIAHGLNFLSNETAAAAEESAQTGGAPPPESPSRRQEQQDAQERNEGNGEHRGGLSQEQIDQANRDLEEAGLPSDSGAEDL